MCAALLDSAVPLSVTWLGVGWPLVRFSHKRTKLSFDGRVVWFGIARTALFLAAVLCVRCWLLFMFLPGCCWAYSLFSV